MTSATFPGFEARRLPGDAIEIDALVGGSGPPLLQLHGWPQTRMTWAAVAPALARDFTVVVPHGWCEDYRAGWGIDRKLDEQDRGRSLPQPLLMLWGEHGTLKGEDGLAAWRAWALQVEGTMVPGGTFPTRRAA